MKSLKITTDSIINSKLFEKMGFNDYAVNFFNNLFPNGDTPIEVLKKYTELGYFSFAKDILKEFPNIDESFEFNTVEDGSIFSLGDVFIKGDAYISKPSYIKGILQVDGKLTVNKTGFIHALDVIANEIDISEQGHIHAPVTSKSFLNIHDISLPENTTALEFSINFLECTIFGNVRAEIINIDGGLIFGYVFINDITNINIINNGEIDGEIIVRKPRVRVKR